MIHVECKMLWRKRLARCLRKLGKGREKPTRIWVHYTCSLLCKQPLSNSRHKNRGTHLTSHTALCIKRLPEGDTEMLQDDKNIDVRNLHHTVIILSSLRALAIWPCAMIVSHRPNMVAAPTNLINRTADSWKGWWKISSNACVFYFTPHACKQRRKSIRTPFAASQNTAL